MRMVRPHLIVPIVRIGPAFHATLAGVFSFQSMDQGVDVHGVVETHALHDVVSSVECTGAEVQQRLEDSLFVRHTRTFTTGVTGSSGGADDVVDFSSNVGSRRRRMCIQHPLVER